MSIPFNEPVNVQTVSDLYASFAALDIPGYYKEGEVNPYAGRCAIVPKKASFYIMVPETEEDRVATARRVMKGLAGRKKVREVKAEKHEVNYDQFARASRIVVMYV